MATATTPINELKPPLTVEQWASLEGTPNCELIEGRLQEKADVAIWHDILLVDLLRFLANYVDAKQLGKLVSSTTPLRISTYQGRKPDIFFIPKSLYRFVGKNLFKGVPPLAVEILSPSTQTEDRVQKRRDYADLGIEQYWIVDFPNRRIEVLALGQPTQAGRRYELIRTISGEEVFRPDMFPGLEIPLARIWPTEFETGTDE